MNNTPRPVVLAILDGLGHAHDNDHNAVSLASTPTLDMLQASYPHGLINASELHVGLPGGQMGNSEVGHMNIGSGRVVMQDLPRIDVAAEDGTLAAHPKLNAFIDTLKKSGGACHVLGLVSPGGVHAHQAHIAFIARTVAQAGVPVHIHAFLDGRDTPPQSALEYIAALEHAIAGSGARISTVSGRYFAMDRDNRWERVKLAYDTLTQAQGETFADATSAINASYAAKKSDEFILPCVIGDYAGMQNGDGVFMANFRSDRAREILSALLDDSFTGFARSAIDFSAALGMVEYSTAHNRFMETLFAPESLTAILGEVVSRAGLKQLRIAETEKYAHVTFFFNGGREAEFPGESRILIPSPKVATYDLQPEMSAREVTDKLVEAIAAETFDLIVVNYANTDMVGHTGDIQAAKKAVETVDECLGRVYEAVAAKRGALIVTADHGNAEMMHDDDTNQPHTAHTLNLVPIIIATANLKGTPLELPEGRLADIAPTVLYLMRLQQPAEMTGRCLLTAAAYTKAAHA